MLHCNTIAAQLLKLESRYEFGALVRAPMRAVPSVLRRGGRWVVQGRTRASDASSVPPANTAASARSPITDIHIGIFTGKSWPYSD